MGVGSYKSASIAFVFADRIIQQRFEPRSAELTLRIHIHQIFGAREAIGCAKFNVFMLFKRDIIPCRAIP